MKVKNMPTFIFYIILPTEEITRTPQLRAGLLVKLGVLRFR